MNLLIVSIKAIFVGMAISAPMGPSGMLCLYRTINKGRFWGVMTGIGVALSDMLYAIATGVGQLFVTSLNEGKQGYIIKLTCLFLFLLYGVWVSLKKSCNQIKMHRKNKTSIMHDMATGFLLTISNPAIIVLIALLFGVFDLNWTKTPLEVSVKYSSIFVGCILWWYLFATFVQYCKQKKVAMRYLDKANKLIGVIMILISAVGIIITII